MGKPGWRSPVTARAEPTRGTETSKYPEEEKSKEIPLVAASEEGRAQTGVWRHVSGLWGLAGGFGKDSRTVWKGRPEGVKVP